MTESHPPAPDWRLGDDGHWKPPAFQLEDEVVSSDGDDEGRRPKKDRTRAKAEAKRLGRSALGGVLGLALLAGAVAAGSSVYNGVKEDEAAESPFSGPSEARERYQGAADIASTDLAAAGADAAFCPTPEEVASATGDTAIDGGRYAIDETTRVNGIPLWGHRCNYGDHVTVGAERPGVEGDVTGWVRDSTGDYVISDGPLAVASVTVTEPPDAGVDSRGAGSVRVVFDIGDRTFWVMVDTALEDRVDELAGLVLARNGGGAPAPTTTAAPAPAGP